MLTNVSYRRYIPEDVEKTNFVIDVFPFITQNLNPTGLDRKLEIPLERDYVKMIWDSCVQHEFSKFIYQIENVIELSQPHIASKSKQYCYKICWRRCAKYLFVKYCFKRSFANNPVCLFLTFSKYLQQNQQVWNKQQIPFWFYF